MFSSLLVNLFIDFIICNVIFKFKNVYVSPFYNFKNLTEILYLDFFFIFISFFVYNFYWSAAGLQCCASFKYTAKSISYTYTYYPTFFSVAFTSQNSSFSIYLSQFLYIINKFSFNLSLPKYS